jgi:flagellar M-ring protein FliF
VLLLGVRPLAKGLMKKRDDANPALGAPIGGADGALANTDGITVADPVSLDRLEQSRGTDERIGAVRGFTRDNPARAALAVRDMIKAEAK